MGELWLHEGERESGASWHVSLRQSPKMLLLRDAPAKLSCRRTKMQP